MGAAGAAGLVEAFRLSEPIQTVFQVPIVIAFLVGVIGFTGALGIPLPWPFVPRWVVKIRKTKRARARQRRVEKRANKKKSRGTE